MTEQKIRKVVFFAGGRGSRLSELTEEIPKPLVTIGDDPIIVHIMRHFYSYGYDEFIIAVGYKSEMFKRYFRDYLFKGHDVTFKNGKMHVHNCERMEDWTVHIVETGLESTTSQRLHKVREFIGDEPFFLTYGDSLSDVNLHEVERTHFNHEVPKLATMTAVTKGERFGILDVDDSGTVTKFKEKQDSRIQIINGGFIACSNELLNKVSEDSGDFGFETLDNLAENRQLGYFMHDGFWHAMDSKKDHDDLEELFRHNPSLFGQTQ